MARNPHPREGRSEPQGRRRHAISRVRRGGVEHRSRHGRAVTGPVKLAGPLGALETHVDLHSRGGAVRGDGTLMLDLPHYGARDLQVTASDLNLAHWLGRGAPPSRLSLTLRGDFAGDSAVPPLGTVRAIVEPSQLAGAGVDSGALRVRVPAGRGHFTWQPGPAPTFALDASLDSIAHGMFGFSAAFAAARGTRDSLTWQARSRIGEGGAFLAGGRLARHAAQTGGAALAVGVDSLAVHLPGDVWVLERPTELTVTDSAATVTGLALRSAYGSGKLVLEGALPTRARASRSSTCRRICPWTSPSSPCRAASSPTPCRWARGRTAWTSRSSRRSRRRCSA